MVTRSMGCNGVTIEEACEGPANNNIVVEGFDKERRYHTKEQRSLGKWWKYHILPQHGEE